MHFQYSSSQNNFPIENHTFSYIRKNLDFVKGYLTLGQCANIVKLKLKLKIFKYMYVYMYVCIKKLIYI